MIDEDEIAAGGIQGPDLMVGVDGKRTTWAAVDINDGVRERGVLCAPTTTASLNRPAAGLS